MTNPERDLDCSAQLPENVLGECFEGRVWKEFQYVDGEPFLAAPNNFGLVLIGFSPLFTAQALQVLFTW